MLKIRVKPTKLFYITFSLVYLYIILCECEFLPFSRQGYSIISLFFILFSLLRFEVRQGIVFPLLIPLVNSIVVTPVLQLMLGLDPRLLNITTFAGNVALNVAISYLLLILTNSIRWSVIATNVLLFGFTFVDYIVISFRGSEIKMGDFYSIKTGVSVVSQYKLQLNSAVNYSIAVFLAILFVLAVTRFFKKTPKNQFPRITGALCLGASLFAVSWCMNNSNNYMQLWAYEGVKYNGVTYNFLIEARDSRIVAPEGYSEEYAKELLKSGNVTESAESTPNVIVVMNEAFSDLKVLGDFQTNANPIEFFESLNEDCVKGYALSSVYGGNTATSEWEFLTGNTQAFLPYGSIAYQQYIKNKANSIVEVMEDNGYTTIAMHPFRSTGWKRNVVYDVLGFDEVYFEDELSDDYRIRGFVSDRTLYEDIIGRFENKEKDEKIFTFAVTMQNHGGYEFGGFPSEILVDGMDILSVNQYLTLLDKSDDALKYLIEYFSEYEEDTMIVFFGDHQPAVSNDFFNTLAGASATAYDSTVKKFIIPFFIWTNYDTPEEEVPLTSLNYLSTVMMKRAGIGLDGYFAFIDDIMQELPAISFHGYKTTGLEKINHVSWAEGRDKELINKYNIVQYYNMFK